MDSLINAGDYDGAHAEVLPILTDAETHSDSASIARLLVARGRAQLGLGDIGPASSSFDRAIDTAEAARDTVDWMAALGFKALALSSSRRSDEAIRLNEKRLRLARITRDPVSEGWARIGLGYGTLLSGGLDAARDHYARAVDLFKVAGRESAALTALVGLGRVLTMMKNIDAARACYQRVWQTAETIGDRVSVAHAANNLGAIEHRYGDMALAAQYFERARDLHRDAGNVRGMIVAANNVAISRAYLGQYGEAVTILTRGIEACETQNFQDLLGDCLLELGTVRYNQCRYRQATALFRRALALGEAVDKMDRDDARRGLGMSLARMDSVGAAIHVLQSALRQPPAPEMEPLITLALSRCLRMAGRPYRALEFARRTTGPQNPPSVRVLSAFEMSTCLRATARAAGALKWFYRGLAYLDTLRVLTGDYEWRESADTGRAVVNASAVVLEYPPGVSHEDRVEALFGVIQRFKTRTLIERIVEPRRRGDISQRMSDLPEVTLDHVQNTMLHPGDLFLDFAVGDSLSFLFAVTPDSCRVVRLPGIKSDLPEKINIYCKLLGEPPPRSPAGGPTALLRMQRALGDAVFGHARDLIAAASRLVISPDGFFSAIPFGTLVLDGGPPPAAPLIVSKEIWEAPSARVLAYFKRRPDDEHPAPGRVLAIAPGGGTRLPGAAREVRWLADRFAGASVTRDPTTDTRWSKAMANCDIIHVASHVEIDDEKPWRSGILVGARAESTPENRRANEASLRLETTSSRDAQAPPEVQPDPYLRAGDIANLDLPARLAVLAGCSSALGRATSGEGVLGLSSAFLSAGVPVVIATLWPVDDAVTAHLMKAFYTRLAAGGTVAEALRRAQREILSRPATRLPFYWAGFVTVGDGDVAVPLDEAPPGREMLYLLVATGVIILSTALWIGRTRWF